MPRIALAHNIPSESNDSLDVLDQVCAIEEALDDLGFASLRIPFTRNLNSFLTQIRKSHADIIFNLVETVDEEAALASHPAAVFELLDLPFTGSSASALALTTDKVTAKRLMRACGIRTPNYLIYEGAASFNASHLTFPVILKPRFEDASIGIDQDSIYEDERHLRKNIQNHYARYGSLLVEEYIDGREFNVSLFGYPVPQVLPLTEIDFSHFPHTLYPIVGYKAKWDTSSFEYTHTPRLLSRETEPSLAGEINKLAFDCFRLFGLRDYARVDIRATAHNKPYVLEVNANPCLSPDAGFAVATANAGFCYADMVDKIVRFALARSKDKAHHGETGCA
ncbi:MAG: hypothetical protein M0P57_07590 [Syntrophales bacterium]|nr:hypothetical protein [Syntrophales bacterium]MDY0043193.1 hypothetical protein [Syntrophales bacterium]